MSLFLKAKIHVKMFVNNRNLKYGLHDLLLIVNRRSPFLNLYPKGVSGKEKFLERYMFPKHNGCFIDIGANMGLWSFFMAEKGVIVHSFEPNPDITHILLIESEKFDNVKTYGYALGNRNCVNVPFNIHSLSGHSSIVFKQKDYVYTVDVPMRTLDSFNFENVGLIKIDTEGYEIPILLGARKTIVNNEPRLIIEVHKPFNEQKEKIEKFLKWLGYKFIVKYKSSVNRQPYIIADSSFECSSDVLEDVEEFKETKNYAEWVLECRKRGYEV